MIKLKEMNNHEFNTYLDFMIPDYAKDISDNYNLPIDKAMEESEMMMKDLFPDGLSTDGQFLYNLYDPVIAKEVGIIWFRLNLEINRVYLYHIYIKETYRQKGYATKALEELQDRVRGRGIDSISLSVFGNNEHAYRLYTKLGFTSSAISMHKLL